jgi:hypothetical protein
MEELASELLKELNCDTAFSIKLPAGLPLIGGVGRYHLGGHGSHSDLVDYPYKQPQSTQCQQTTAGGRDNRDKAGRHCYGNDRRRRQTVCTVSG